MLELTSYIIDRWVWSSDKEPFALIKNLQMGGAGQGDGARATQLWPCHQETSCMPWACCDGRAGTPRVKSFRVLIISPSGWHIALNWHQEFCVAFFKMDSKLGEERPGGRVVAARTKKQASNQKQFSLFSNWQLLNLPFLGDWRGSCNDVSLVWSSSFRLRSWTPSCQVYWKSILFLIILCSMYFRFLSHYETRDGYYSMLSYVRVSFLQNNTQDNSKKHSGWPKNI